MSCRRFELLIVGSHADGLRVAAAGAALGLRTALFATHSHIELNWSERLSLLDQLASQALAELAAGPAATATAGERRQLLWTSVRNRYHAAVSARRWELKHAAQTAGVRFVRGPVRCHDERTILAQGHFWRAPTMVIATGVRESNPDANGAHSRTDPLVTPAQLLREPRSPRRLRMPSADLTSELLCGTIARLGVQVFPQREMACADVAPPTGGLTAMPQLAAPTVIGRTAALGLARAGIEVDPDGRLWCDDELESTSRGWFGIGSVVSQRGLSGEGDDVAVLTAHLTRQVRQSQRRRCPAPLRLYVAPVPG